MRFGLAKEVTKLELRRFPAATARSGEAAKCPSSGPIGRPGWCWPRVLCRLRLALYLPLFCIPLFPQYPSATITGWISDQTARAISGATVTVTAVDTGVSLKTETNSDGVYRVSGLMAGVYRISISKEGFQSLAQDGLQLHVGCGKGVGKVPTGDEWERKPIGTIALGT